MQKYAEDSQLIFPEDDRRCKLPQLCCSWLYQGSICTIIGSTAHLLCVVFKGAPKNRTDLVSPEFIKKRNAVSII